MQRGSPKDGNHYDRLAALARDAGFHRVTASVVQSWVKHGLIPRVRYDRPAFGVRVPVGLPEIEAQLLALCRLRYEHRIRSYVELGLTLWTEGWNVDESVGRESFRRYLAPLMELADEEARDEFALRAAETPTLWSQAPRRDVASTALALDTLLALLTGARPVQGGELDDLAYLENASGLQRARTDQLDDVGPWLPTPPGVGLAQGAEGVAAPRLLAAVDAATPNELAVAREHAQRLQEYFAVAIPMMTMAAGSGFAGFGPLADAVGDPRLRIMLVLVALVLPDAAARMVDGLPTTAALAEWRAGVEAGLRMFDEDDELAARAAAVGLVAALGERSSAIAEGVNR